MKNLKGENSTIILLIVFAASVIILKLFVIDFFIVSSNSMLPVLKKGDIVLLLKKNVTQSNKGEVVVFKSPEENKKLVKRMAGIAGEPMAKFGLQDRMTEYTDRNIPANHFFALGDNSSDSYDSRYFGPIDNADAIGSVQFIIWSSDSTGTNWNRIFSGVK
mgnify:CR=1 FL=1